MYAWDNVCEIEYGSSRNKEIESKAIKIHHARSEYANETENSYIRVDQQWMIIIGETVCIISMQFAWQNNKTYWSKENENWSFSKWALAFLFPLITDNLSPKNSQITDVFVVFPTIM